MSSTARTMASFRKLSWRKTPAWSTESRVEVAATSARSLSGRPMCLGTPTELPGCGRYCHWGATLAGVAGGKALLSQKAGGWRGARRNAGPSVRFLPWRCRAGQRRSRRWLNMPGPRRGAEDRIASISVLLDDEVRPVDHCLPFCRCYV